jgi:poly(hydroxyalkanoate) depolymerase family esterase
MLKRLAFIAAAVLIAALTLGVSKAPTQKTTTSGTGGVSPTGHARVERRNYPNGYAATVYTPASVTGSRPVPLVVMLHGCSTSADSMEAATQLDQQAERGRFQVLYADGSGPQPWRCWRFGADTTRGTGDAAAIAAMVRDAIHRRTPNIDRSRIYVSGMSSGASMAIVLAAAYPDMFAAVAINAGCAYRGAPCGGHTPSQPTATLAQEALAAMGTHRRVVPVFVSQGDQDKTVPGHSAQVIEQWRQTDNAVASGSIDVPIGANASSTRTVKQHGRYTSTVQEYDAKPGCEVLERWTIHGMGHFWPGGTTDPEFAGYTDPKGPNGAQLIWSFLSRYRMSPNPCA